MDISVLMSNGQRVYLEGITYTLVDNGRCLPVAVFTCRLDDPFYRQAKETAEQQLKAKCEWVPLVKISRL